MDILFEKTGGVATISLHRPEKRNAFRSQTLREITAAVKDASRDPAVGVIVLKGSSPGDFCTGGDIEEMRSFTPRTGRAFVTRLRRTAEALLSCHKPVIAQVDGYCLGGGNELQLFCDLTIASDRAVFGQVGANVGSAPLWGGTQILPHLLGMKKAKEMMFLCPRVSAREAQALGLINDCVPPKRLSARVREVCRELLLKSPQSLRVIKQSLNRGVTLSLGRDLKTLRSLYGTPELREGMRAFLEKRLPRFR